MKNLPRALFSSSDEVEVQVHLEQKHEHEQISVYLIVLWMVSQNICTDLKMIPKEFFACVLNKCIKELPKTQG